MDRRQNRRQMLVGTLALPLAAGVVQGQPPANPTGHHRGHAIAFLNEAGKQAGNALNARLPEFLKTICATDQVRHGAEITYITGGLQRNINTAKVAVTLLGEVLPAGLFSVRQMINQPQHGQTEPKSALRESAIVMNQALKLADVITPQNVNLYLGLVQSIHSMWNEFDRAAWHPTDAINEEYYKDPDFFEVE